MIDQRYSSLYITSMLAYFFRSPALFPAALILSTWLGTCHRAWADEPTVLKGHEAIITCLAYSPDGTLLASGSKDGYVRIWDLKTGTTRHSFAGHTRMATDVAFTPDGKSLASAADD